MLHAVFPAGRIRRGAQVEHLAVIGQRHERVAEPSSKEYRPPVLIIETDRLPFPERGRADPHVHIDIDIDDRAADRRSWWILGVYSHAPSIPSESILGFPCHALACRSPACTLPFALAKPER